MLGGMYLRFIDGLCWQVSTTVQKVLDERERRQLQKDMRNLKPRPARDQALVDKIINDKKNKALPAAMRQGRQPPKPREAKRIIQETKRAKKQPTTTEAQPARKSERASRRPVFYGTDRTQTSDRSDADDLSLSEDDKDAPFDPRQETATSKLQQVCVAFTSRHKLKQADYPRMWQAMMKDTAAVARLNSNRAKSCRSLVVNDGNRAKSFRSPVR